MGLFEGEGEFHWCMVQRTMEARTKTWAGKRYQRNRNIGVVLL